MDECTHIGLDVHKDTIAVAVLRPHTTEVDERVIPNTPEAIRRLLARHDPHLTHACYEAGPTGYDTHRLVTSLGFACDVIAPSMIPRRSGARVKTDRIDARNLARLHRAGERHTPERSVSDRGLPGNLMSTCLRFGCERSESPGSRGWTPGILPLHPRLNLVHGPSHDVGHEPFIDHGKLSPDRYVKATPEGTRCESDTPWYDRSRQPRVLHPHVSPKVQTALVDDAYVGERGIPAPAGHRPPPRPSPPSSGRRPGLDSA